MITKQKNIITLVGMMGCGKTSVGRKLANKIGYYFIDSDSEIEDKEGRSISEIFKTSGESYFRQLEEETIIKLLDKNENMVISTGGGSFINEKIRSELKKKSVTIWLSASVETIFSRIGRKNNRPLISSGNKKKTLSDLIEKRYPIYAQADLKIDVDQIDTTAAIEEITTKLSIFNGTN